MAKKIKKTFARQRKTGIGAAPTDSFHKFNDYIRMEVDKKEIAQVVKAWIKETQTKEDQKTIFSGPAWMFENAPHIVTNIVWAKLGFDYPSNWNSEKAYARYISEAKRWGLIKIEERGAQDDVPVASRTPSEIAAEKCSDFIAGIEAEVDNWKNSEACIYSNLQSAGSPVSTAHKIVAYYKPQCAEIEELINDKPEDLVEAYAHMSRPEQKKYGKFLQSIIDAADRYLSSKKATRKPRTPVVKSALKQTGKVQYEVENKEFQLTSINPMLIPGSSRLLVFNTKYKFIAEYVSHRPNGFEIKGTTLQGYDVEQSRATALRKPTEFLKSCLKKTVKQIDKDWSDLTTKSSVPNGRLNKNTILLRVMDK